MNKLNRRDFLKTTLLTTASLSLFPALRSSASPNEEIGVAVVGFHGRGRAHIEGYSRVKGTRLVALCDVDQHVMDAELKRCANQKPKSYTDIRKLLENPDVDIVSIAMPNHWHSLAGIWSIQAGKDVYVEKPVSHEVWEGRQLVKAARNNHRIVQTGTQCRSSSGITEAIQWVREGNIGKIIRARGLCYKRRPSIGKVDHPTPIPEWIDYNLWCGPAPEVPLMRKHLHYDWHWVWPTGNGDLGNQGIHQMDIARWALGEPELSPRVLSVGGRLGYIDDGTTPNTLIVFHDYPAAPLIFEVRGLPSKAGSNQMDSYRGARIGVVVDCEAGSMVIPSYDTAIIYDKNQTEIKRFRGASSHFQNFIDAVRSRKYTDLHADILQGHVSSALCHTGNISYRLGKKRPPEEIRDGVKADRDLAEAVGRMEEHLGANNIDLHKTPATLGVALRMNPSTERFIGNRRANRLLRRHYRNPFVVPAKV
jgi:predicted dehydrogenase